VYPAEHAAHVATDVAPVDDENFPAGHVKQAEV
jgi:hypothetical protein